MILNVNTKPLSSYGIPEFTYTGTYEIVDDNNVALTDLKAKNWKIRFLTSGDLTFTNLKGAKRGVDIFLVGGGGKGGNGYNYGSSGGTGGGGGGGGHIINNFFTPSKTKYTITIGGSAGNTSAFGFTASCGSNGGNGNTSSGGSGGAGTGSGGKGGNRVNSTAVNGGNGGDGVYEFGEVNSLRYGGGGAGGAGYWETWDDEGWKTNQGDPGVGGAGGGGSNYTAGATNTGGGGCGGHSGGSNGSAGGSGIVIIRNTRSLSWDGLFEATPTTTVNVRSSPQIISSPSNIVGQVAKGQKVAVYDLQAGLADNYVWGKINLPNLAGWVALQNFTYNAYCEVNNEEGAILYSSTDISSSQVLTLSKGKKFFSTAVSQTNKIIWLQVTIEINENSYSGYILNDKIKFLSKR